MDALSVHSDSSSHLGFFLLHRLGNYGHSHSRADSRDQSWPPFPGVLRELRAGQLPAKSPKRFLVSLVHATGPQLVTSARLLGEGRAQVLLDSLLFAGGVDASR